MRWVSVDRGQRFPPLFLAKLTLIDRDPFASFPIPRARRVSLRERVRAWDDGTAANGGELQYMAANRAFFHGRNWTAAQKTMGVSGVKLSEPSFYHEE